MKVSRIISILVMMTISLTCTSVEGGTFAALSDCLITDDIEIYSYKSERANIGTGAGVIGLAGHFDIDHSDTVCTGRYSNINQIRGLPHEELRQKLISVKVQVTEHAGSESDKWLLHEVEKSFRTSYGMPGDPYAMRVIDGNIIMVYGSAGWTYRWVSGNKVIYISYYDSQMEKPEPLEIVSAYLAKHPSTLTPITSADLRTDTNKTTWIKDEMDRRLWLCDKWVEQKQAGTVDVDKLLKKMHDHMKVFLNYKKKYYGIDTDSEKITIYEYMRSKDEAAMKNKLAEYKAWWTANKDGAINL